MSLFEPLVMLALLVSVTLLARQKNYRLTSASMTFVTVALAVLLIYAVAIFGV